VEGIQENVSKIFFYDDMVTTRVCER